ncbi:MAG: zinc ribbon domain-containing protein [Emergencia sp.]
METKTIIYELRTKNGMSQDELAEKLFVTRQAVSRWENGETVPNTETLKLLSGLFDVSINTLLGSPRTLICQCCGMPLDDSTISKEPSGEFNEAYCKWCYTDGQFVYRSKSALLDYLVANMPNPENLQDEERREQFDAYLSQLGHWK